jgi:molybdenum cofactor synthesis domain-containing protein
VSDACSRGEREDRSGEVIAEWCADAGHEVVGRDLVPDEPDRISEALVRWTDSGEADVVLTTGGTGFAPRDVTPEATRAVLEKDAPGIAEALRARGQARTPFASLSRGVAGTRGKTLIVNLPGSPGGVGDALEVLVEVMPHIVGLMRDEETDHMQSPDRRT